MNKIPLVDLKRQYESIQSEVHEAIHRVLLATSFIQGPEVKAFEEEYKNLIGAETIGVSSGTAALFLCLDAMGVGPGDEVITTSHTFIATAEAIVQTGARPVFIDIDEATYNMDPAKLKAAITSKTKAVIAVHLYGLPSNLTEIRKITDEHKLYLIEDAAQAHLSEINGKKIGTFGHVACFSFYPGKNLGAYGDAGAVTGTDTDLLKKIRMIRDHGRTSKYEHVAWGYGERMDGIQAAILRAKLPHLPKWTARRIEVAAEYDRLLQGVDVQTPVTPPGFKHVFHLYVIRTKHRDALLAYFKEQGIEAGIHYPIPLHLQPCYKTSRYPECSLPVTEKIASEILSLPIFPEMTLAEQARVVDTLKGFLKNVSK